MGNQLIPAGTVVYVARDTAPEGWLVADGREVSRTQYADLFAAIRVKFGMGDGIDTFGLPDLRGEFIRGLDSGRGVDAGRKFGSSQNDAFANHSHPTGSYGGNIGSGDVVYNRVGLTAGQDVLQNSTKSVGDTETRPRNIALLACIKY
jgi:microcystin-dependent protein